ncbi:hypothetical protein ACFQH6_19735 [Halobacteriaceae archaeon GCM10025711]
MLDDVGDVAGAERDHRVHDRARVPLSEPDAEHGEDGVPDAAFDRPRRRRAVVHVQFDVTEPAEK